MISSDVNRVNDAGTVIDVPRNVHQQFIQMFLTRDSFWSLTPKQLQQRLTIDNIDIKDFPDICNGDVSAQDLLINNAFSDQVHPVFLILMF